MINNISQTSQLTTELKNSGSSTQSAGNKAAPKSPEVTQTAVDDGSVDISEATRLAQDVQGTLASFPDVDADKVASLKQQIQSGGYEVDSSRLAAKTMMLENMIGDDANGPT